MDTYTFTVHVQVNTDELVGKLRSVADALSDATETTLLALGVTEPKISVGYSAWS